MKRITLIVISALLLLMLCACGQTAQEPEPSAMPAVPTEKSERDLLSEQHWYNIHNGDCYVLNSDGSGNHNGISLTFTAEEDRISIMEGVAALQAKTFRLDRSGPYPRLIPDGETSFYVMETDYRELAPMVRRESIQILLSYELWKVSTMNGYLTFYENGTGSLKAPQSNVNQDTTWEMIDNNTLRCYLPMDSTKQGVNDLEIVNDNGQYKLLTDDPAVYYTPHGDPRPAVTRTSSIAAIDTAIGYTICLTKDGTAVSVGIDSHGQRKTDNWKNLKDVRGANMHTVGLRTDGTVIATGDNEQGQCNVGSWSKIVMVDTGYFHTVGLRKDGTAVGTGYTKDGQCHLQDWKDLTVLSAGGYHTLGLKKDGTVVANGFNEDGRCDVQSWENIVAVSGGGFHSVGLKSDGTVVAVGQNKYGQCDVDGWTDIVAISAGEYHTVGLKADGTVVAVGSNTYNQCRTGAWCDIVAISAGGAHTVGLKENGAVVIIGNNDLGQSEAEALMKAAS